MAKIIELDEVDSTNEYLKRLGGDEDAIVSAARQTSGRGTKGRAFVSDEGGVYVSVLRIRRDFDFSKAFSIMITSCVAVCRTVEEYGLRPVIKWSNDVLVGGRKISGTLIENTLSSGNICRSIVGIGLNVNNAFSGELKAIATSMSEQAGHAFSVAEVRRTLTKNLEREYTVADYKRYIDWFGRQVIIIREGERTLATALDVDDVGRLVVSVGGEVERLSSGEISLRLT